MHDVQAFQNVNLLSSSSPSFYRKYLRLWTERLAIDTEEQWLMAWSFLPLRWASFLASFWQRPIWHLEWCCMFFGLSGHRFILCNLRSFSPNKLPNVGSLGFGVELQPSYRWPYRPGPDSSIQIKPLHGWVSSASRSFFGARHSLATHLIILSLSSCRVPRGIFQRASASSKMGDGRMTTTKTFYFSVQHFRIDPWLDRDTHITIDSQGRAHQQICVKCERGVFGQRARLLIWRSPSGILPRWKPRRGSAQGSGRRR